MNKIRKYLATIVGDKNEENWYKPDLFIKNTLSKLPKELIILENPPRENENYNCFVYVLGLNKDKKIIKETKGFIYSNFFQTLINKGELEFTDSHKNGDIILYLNPKQFGSEITHSGIVQENETIVSKWSWGPIIKHNIFDVPDFYGDRVKYVKGINLEKSKRLYNQYKEFNKDIHS